MWRAALSTTEFEHTAHAGGMIHIEAMLPGLRRKSRDGT
jgi:hypothetical protein